MRSTEIRELRRTSHVIAARTKTARTAYVTARRAETRLNAANDGIAGRIDPESPPARGIPELTGALHRLQVSALTLHSPSLLIEPDSAADDQSLDINRGSAPS